jgi:hypothetical protein
MNPLSKIFTRLFLLLFSGMTFAGGGSKCFGQKITNPFLETRFLKDSVKTAENSFYFNSLTLRNTSGRVLDLSIVLEEPCFVNLVSDKNQTVLLKPDENYILPFRFSGNSKNGCAADWMNFNVKMIDASANFVHEASFALRPAPSVKWKAQLVLRELIITNNTSKVTVAFKIENNGNLPDKYSVSFSNDFTVANYKSLITLAPNESSLEQIELKLTEAEIKSLQKKEFTIFLVNISGEKKSLVQKITRVESIFRDNVDAWKRVPITAELNSIGLLKNNTFHFMRIFGSQLFSRERRLSFTVQTPTIYSNGDIQKAASPIIDYTSPRLDVSAGLMYETNEFIVFGDGLRIRFKEKIHDWYEASYNKSSFSDLSQVVLKMSREIRKNLLYSTNNIANLDHTNKSNGYASLHRLDWSNSIGFKLNVETGFGFSNQKTTRQDTTVKGPMIGFAGEKYEGKIQGHANLRIYSKNFPGIYKGYTHYVHDLSYKIRKSTIGSYVEIGNQQPFLYIDSAFQENFNYLIKNISLRYGYSSKKISFIAYPGILSQKQDSLNSPQANMKKISSTLYLTVRKKWQVSYANHIGTVTISNNKSIAPIFSMYHSLNIQSLHTGVLLRYDEGPFFYRDITEYIDKGIYKTILQAAPFVYYSFPKINVDVRGQLNILTNKPSNENSFQFLNNIFWNLPEKSLTVGLNTTVDLRNTSSSSVDLLLRKKLNVPVVKKRSYKNFRIILFKDVDGDGKKSDSDVLISNAYFIIEKRLLQTNQVGEILVENFAGNAINLDISPINNVIGWVPVGGLKQAWPVTGQSSIYVPFKKAKLLSGKLVLDKDEKSTTSFDIEGIRITAVARDGTTYSTLTGGDGGFYLNLLDDEYVVSINQNVFDETFKIIDPVRNIDLVHNNKAEVIYIVRQKRREIIIKKQ